MQPTICCAGVLKTDMLKLERRNNYGKSFKNVFGVYDGLYTDTLRHIPEISFYNHNYYIGLKRGNSTIHDLLFAVSNDDYCRCCPIKDESCWLKGFKKPSGKKENVNLSVTVIHARILNRTKGY